MQAGLVFNIQRRSIQDGPGIRTTVFFKGCPLSCAWCQNPESQSATREIVVVKTRCINCGQCVLACPAGGKGPALSTNVEGCIECGKCTEACPTGARQIIGQRMTVADVMAEIQKDRVLEPFGGVTFSGGEPLAQPVFLLALLQACQTQGLHTAVDTCGYGSTDRLLTIAPLVDLFLYDLKFLNDSNHKRYCGVSNEIILENLKELDHVHQNIWVRVPVVPGITDSEENLQGIADFVAKLKHVTQINLLPYHRRTGPKYERLGENYSLKEIGVPSVGLMKHAAKIFHDHGREARLGG